MGFLDDGVVLVTGATDGRGRGVATRLAELGTPPCAWPWATTWPAWPAPGSRGCPAHAHAQATRPADRVAPRQASEEPVGLRAVRVWTAGRTPRRGATSRDRARTYS